MSVKVQRPCEDKDCEKCKATEKKARARWAESGLKPERGRAGNAGSTPAVSTDLLD